MQITKIYIKQELVFSCQWKDSLLLGRQSVGEPEPVKLIDADGKQKVVIAPLQDQRGISRGHIELQELNAETNKIQVHNKGPKLSVENVDLSKGESNIYSTPIHIVVGNIAINVESPGKENVQGDENITLLPEATRAPGSIVGNFSRIPSTVSESQEVTSFLKLFGEAISVLESTAGSHDFFTNASQATLEMIGLDTATVLLEIDGVWKEQRVCSSGFCEAGWQPSQRIIAQVIEQKRTVSSLPDNRDGSIVDLTAILAAPILDVDRNVIGILYGERKGEGGDPVITEIEARFAELLACGIAGGLARLKQEREAAELRAQFERVFSTELAEQLQKNPAMLETKDTEVTMMFCDVRGYSRICESLSAVKSVEWIRSVMDALSECVLRHKGVLVDYLGDAVIAMWGAPSPQPNQADLACAAAVDMVNCIPGLCDQWKEDIPDGFAIGVGINSGIASVGNTGSNKKYKYGANGHTVNVASRIEGATKHLQSSILITGETHSRLQNKDNTRCLRQIMVVNVPKPINVYEVNSGAEMNYSVLKYAYEEALSDFEHLELESSREKLESILEKYPKDKPTKLLLDQLNGFTEDSEKQLCPVWKLSGK